MTRLQTPAGGARVVERTSDGSFITYSHEEDANGKLLSGQAIYTDGSFIQFEASANDGGTLLPTQIIDRNGNAVWLYYERDTPRITLLEACGRHVNFHYDSDRRLTALTCTGPLGAEVELVRLHYADTILRHNFALPVELVGPVALIDAVFFPGKRSGYNFQDQGTHYNFSPYGMLRRVPWYQGMAMSTPKLSEQGDVTSMGTLMWVREYDYPTNIAALVDSPTYRTVTETWAHGQETAVTTFAITHVPGGMRTETIWPDHSRTVETAETPATLSAPVLTEFAVYAQAGQLLQQTVLQWERGHEGVPRVRSSTIVDERGRRRLTSFAFGDVENLVTDVRYSFFGGGGVARRVHTEYLSSPAYAARHLQQLPTRVEIFDQDGEPASCTEYEYDTLPILPRSRPSCHSSRFDPLNTSYDPATIARGNPTIVRACVNAAQHDFSIVEQRQYDSCGNLCVRDSEGRRDEFTYSAATRFQRPDGAFTGSPDPTSPLRMRLWSASYDAGLFLSVYDGCQWRAHRFQLRLREHGTVELSVGDPWLVV